MEMPWVGFRRGRMPSRHSGESSLSANEPRSSDTRMSMGPWVGGWGSKDGSSPLDAVLAFGLSSSSRGGGHCPV